MSDYELNYVKKSGSYYTAYMYCTEYLLCDSADISTSIQLAYADLKHLLEVNYGITLPNKSKLKLYGKDRYKNEYYLLEQQLRLAGKAEHSQLSNDLFWRYSFFDLLTGDFVTIRWQGYNDSFWWNNVAPTDQARVRKGSNGRQYKIDFNTNKVWELQNEN